MKNVLIGILVVCVIALAIVTGNLYGKVQSKQNELVAQEQKMNEIETQKVTSESKKTNSEKLNVKFDENKMKLKAKDVAYESINYYTNYGITISLSENNQVTINTNPQNENYQSIFSKITKTSINEEITGFSGNVVDVCEMAWGQTLMEEPKVLFLMEDGTVEYADLLKMIKNKDYTSSGKIEELSDIVRFGNMSVGMLDNDGTRTGGYITTLAIDKDGYAYDLGEIEFKEKENDVELEEIPIGDVSKQKFKICTNHDTCYYSKEESLRSNDDLGVKINISNQKAYITINVQNENLQTSVNSTDLAKLKNVKNQEIVGFSAEPIQVYYGEFGHDILGREILFLMDDGTVEHIKLMDMLENQNYKSAGKIKRLSDIKQFDVLAVSDTEGGGYITTIAIDKDGYYYDLNELL